MSQQQIRLLFAAVFLASFTGCGDDPPPTPKADVSGAVMLNGKAFTGVSVRFYHASLGGGAFTLDEKGQFASNAPITVGTYEVTMDRTGPIPGETPADMKWPKDRLGELPEKYRKTDKSGLTAEVVEEGENHFVFELEGKARSGQSKRAAPEPIAPVQADE